MRRLLLSIWFVLALATGALAQGCGDQNPNCIVPTAPAGTNNNQAASTAFVQQNLSVSNVLSFNASGSTTSTTGTISASSRSLALAAAIDFKNGQGIRINGAGATFATNPPTGLGVVQNGSTGAATYQYQVASLDAAGGVGVAVAAVSINNGNATLTSTNSITVSWTAPASGPTPAAYAVYGKASGSMTLLAIVSGFEGGAPAVSWTDTGTTTVPSPDWLPSAVQTSALNDYLLTTISSGAGTTSLTLAVSATNAVIGATVDHDDTAAINAAIGALPANGGIVAFPVGTYQITTQINLGNGNGSSVVSTSNGMKIVGLGARGAFNAISGLPIIFPVNIKCFSYSICIKVNGPLVGWGIENISIDLTGIGATVNDALVVESGGYGNVNGLLVNGAYNISVLDRTQQTGAAIAAQQNTYNDIQLILPSNSASSVGIQLSGTATTDVFNYSFRQVQISPHNAGHICIRLISTDSDLFQRVMCGLTSPAATAIAFNYSVNSSWPANVIFEEFEGYTNGYTNSGSPSTASRIENKIYGFSLINGATVPQIANLVLPDFMYGGATPTISAGCSGAGSSVSGNNYHGTVTGSTSAATSCTLSFAAPSFVNSPDCVAQGYSSPLTGSVVVSGTTSLQVSFTSTSNFKWSYWCQNP